MSFERHYSFIDRFCIQFDQVLKTLDKDTQTTLKKNPGHDWEDFNFDKATRKKSAALMRVNHAGEICAQALYHGQSVITKNVSLQQYLLAAAQEEGDHLAWCKTRLDELESHPSYLNPLWYGGAFCIGIAAGWVGDRISLGFIAETERQVIKHLDKHLKLLPEEDKRSHAILSKMNKDEAKHREEAIAKGATELPRWIKWLMNLTSKVMVKTAYWI